MDYKVLESLASQSSFCQSLQTNYDKEVFTFGFIDGFKAARELAEKKLGAYAAYIAGNITRDELDTILGQE